jgi:hypothetical protein
VSVVVLKTNFTFVRIGCQDSLRPSQFPIGTLVVIDKMAWLIVRLSYLHAAENLCKYVDLWPVGNGHSPPCESLLARQLSHSGLAMDPRLGISTPIVVCVTLC